MKRTIQSAKKMRFLQLQLSQKLLILFAIVLLSFSSKAQNFEISSYAYDSLSPTGYLLKVSGFATFTDSMVMEIELTTSDSLETIVYYGSKDFSSGGQNTLTNFTYNSSSEAFSLDIGTYSSLNYKIRVTSKINGVLEEELFINTY